MAVVCCSPQYSSDTNCILRSQLLGRTQVKLENSEHFVCSLLSLLGLLSVSRCKKVKYFFFLYYWGLIYSSVPQWWNRHRCQESLPRLFLNNFLKCPLAWRCKLFYWGIACYSLHTFFFLDLRPPESMSLLSEPAAERSKVYCTILPEL